MSTKNDAAAGVLLGGNKVTLKQKINGKLVDKEFELVPYADLPRKTRRELRNALFKAAPEHDAASDKADLFTASYEAGVIALRAAGAFVDPNDESLSAKTADELDKLIMAVGIRVLGEANRGGGDPKAEDETPAADTPTAETPAVESPEPTE